jgi:hypothetical protein
MTKRRPGRSVGDGSSAEVLEEGGALSVTETPQSPVRSDSQLLHEALGLDFAQTRERLEDRLDLHPADVILSLPSRQHFHQRYGSGLEELFHFGPEATRLARLGQRCSSLFGRKYRWSGLSHEWMLNDDPPHTGFMVGRSACLLLSRIADNARATALAAARLASQ